MGCFVCFVCYWLGVLDIKKTLRKALDPFKSIPFAAAVAVKLDPLRGDYFEAYLGSTELCNYNIGIDSMASIWKDSCLERQVAPGLGFDHRTNKAVFLGTDNLVSRTYLSKNSPKFAKAKNDRPARTST